MRTSFIGQFIEKVNPKAGVISPVNSSPFAIVDKIREKHALTMVSHSDKEQLERLAIDQLCEVTRAKTIALISKTIVEV